MSHEHADTCCHGHGHDHGHRHAPRPAVAAIGTLAGNAELRWSDLRIEAMDCPTEERLIRDALGRQPAVESLEFNLMQRLLRVQHRFDSVEPLQKLIAGLGMQAVPLDAGENTDGPSQAPAKPWWPLA
ncbi:heavy-metal-associated domain-containing protein, partial [Pseudomonas aeruginosa]|nr:heavy-metal-associated domain-containing protein [Pseudomonas aeruginosa]